MRKCTLTIAAIGSLTLAGCATSSGGIVANYTSPMLYQAYSCPQLAMENQTLATKVSQLRGRVDHDATQDKVMVGIGVAVFWPALFFIKGDGDAAGEYAELKGQHEAIQQAYIQRGCGSATAAAASPAAAWNAPPAMVEQVRRF
jgi:outer membrane murein-binding lipoprotein Lpp